MDIIYSLFETYGLWILLPILFLGQLGIPIGSTFFLMWYGSTIDESSTLLVAITATACAAILGDTTAFALGTQFSDKLERAENRYAGLAKKLEQTRKLTRSYGSGIIWITRFLITGLGPLVNYLLGSRKYSFKKFAFWVILGEFIFTAELLYFGYRFKDSWEDLLGFIGDAGWLIGLLILFAWVVRQLIQRNKVSASN